jgi:hypothetical protein
MKMSRNNLYKTSAIALALPATVLAYFGIVMLLMVPGDPYHHEAYLEKGRVLYGVLPVFASVGLLAGSGFLWSRATDRRLGRSIALAFAFSAALVFAFFIILVVIANFRHE